MLRRSFARQLLQPRAQLRLPVGQRVRLCWLGCLGRLEIRQHQASEVHVVFPFVTSCRRSSMRQWQICTSLHAVRSSQYLLRNKQITSVASLMAHSKVGTTVIEMQGSFEGVVAGGVFLRHGSRQHQTSSGSLRLSPLVLVNFFASSCWLQADC